jgi:hypothetical protein
MVTVCVAPTSAAEPFVADFEYVEQPERLQR